MDIPSDRSVVMARISMPHQVANSVAENHLAHQAGGQLADRVKRRLIQLDLLCPDTEEMSTDGFGAIEDWMFLAFVKRGCAREAAQVVEAVLEQECVRDHASIVRWEIPDPAGFQAHGPQLGGEIGMIWAQSHCDQGAAFVQHARQVLNGQQGQASS